MAKYEIEISDTEDKALSVVAYDQKEWIENAVKARCLSAIAEVIAINTKKCNEDGIAIATGESGQVDQAFEKKYVRTAKEITDEREKAMGIG